MSRATELREMYHQMMSLYCDIKREVKSLDSLTYERWKAGGFLVDEDVVCMYPNLGKTIETLESKKQDEDPEEEEE